MNERQIALLSLLIERYEIENNNHQLDNYNYFISRSDIQRILRDYYPSTNKNNPYYDKAFHQITKDIQEINDNPEVDYVIISKPSGIRIADKDGVLDLIRERNSIIRKLVRVHRKLKKIDKNGSLRFNLNLEEIELVKSLMEE